MGSALGDTLDVVADMRYRKGDVLPADRIKDVFGLSLSS